MAFADVLGALGAVANRPPGYRGGTIESKTNFFASGVGPVLSAVCVPLHIGRTTSVWQTTIQNADGSKVAMVIQTQISVPAKARDPES
jgi:1,4-dihydroxy-2-naphthoyl-CoA hydrolase